jgi:hypothetical protein
VVVLVVVELHGGKLAVRGWSECWQVLSQPWVMWL